MANAACSMIAFVHFKWKTLNEHAQRSAFCYPVTIAALSMAQIQFLFEVLLCQEETNTRNALHT
jgi:hypothetical protein